MQDTFVLYANYYDILKDCSNEDVGYIFRAILSYIKTGEVIKLPKHLTLAFGFVKNQLDIDSEKYRKAVEAGKKGGRPKKEEVFNDDKQNNSENLPFKSETTLCNQKTTQKPNDNVNDNVNVNVNDNSLSLNNSDEITREEREILENYIEKHKLANKSVKAYANRLIENGDFREILAKSKDNSQENSAINRQQKIKSELASIKDKRSCAKVLSAYFMKGDPPEEFCEVMQKYNLETYDDIEQYARELNNTGQA